MTDWLVVLPEDNWEVGAQEGLLGLGRDAERRLSRLTDGDRVWVYVNRKYVERQLPKIEEIRAIVRVTGPLQRLRRSPWKARGDQHFLIARPVAIERRLRVPAKAVLKTLSFAGSPPAWGLRLLQAPIRLTDKDVTALELAVSTGTAG